MIQYTQCSYPCFEAELTKKYAIQMLPLSKLSGVLGYKMEKTKKVENEIKNYILIKFI